MQKIGQLQAFMELKETQDAMFVHPLGQRDQSRLIKMRILAEHPVNLYVVPVEYDYDTGEVIEHLDDPSAVRFLCHVEPGLEQVEFYWLGCFCLRLIGGNIWLDTYDNTAFNVESVDPDSFARLWEREERDPRILEIERAARHNKLLLEQQMQADRAAFRAEMAAYREEVRSNVAASPSSSSSQAGSTTAQSAGVSSASDNASAVATPAGNGGEPEANA